MTEFGVPSDTCHVQPDVTTATVLADNPIFQVPADEPED